MHRTWAIKLCVLMFLTTYMHPFLNHLVGHAQPLAMGCLTNIMPGVNWVLLMPKWEVWSLNWYYDQNKFILREGQNDWFLPALFHTLVLSVVMVQKCRVVGLKLTVECWLFLEIKKYQQNIDSKLLYNFKTAYWYLLVNFYSLRFSQRETNQLSP